MFDYPAFGGVVWNSVVLSLGSATIIMLITSVLCWIALRTKLPGRWLLDHAHSVASLLRSERRVSPCPSTLRIARPS